MARELKTRYTIVGAGIAGIAAAQAIREVDPRGDLLVINGETAVPYCRPLIVDVLKGHRTFHDIHLREPEWFEERNVSLVTGDPARKLDSKGKRLVLASGRTVEWERLLIAAGSRPAIPPIDGLKDVPAFTLYGRDDVERLKPLCKPGARALLVGVGLIGLQAVTALKELGVEVAAVEVMGKVLPMILDVEAARYVQQRLEQNGIEVHTGSSVKALGPRKGGGHPFVALADGRGEIGFDFAVLTAGVRPDFSLLEGSGVEADRGIRVSPEMETSVPGIYAAGDVTEYRDWIEGRPEIHAHWVNAYRQGRIAGLRMAGGEAASWEPVYLNSLSVFGLPVITIGASRVDRPEGAKVYVSDVPARPAYTRLVVRDGRLVAATFVNTFDRAGVFQYLMREKVDIADVAESLFEGGLQGMEFLDRLHAEAVRGKVDWPASMDRIEWYRKDHKHTRWGTREAAEKRRT